MSEFVIKAWVGLGNKKPAECGFIGVKQRLV